MEMDRNSNSDGKGKYALVQMRKVPRHVTWQSPDSIASAIIKDNTILDYGLAGSDSEFFVIRLKDKHAAKALLAYAKSIEKEDKKFAMQVRNMALRAASMKSKKKPD